MGYMLGTGAASQLTHDKVVITGAPENRKAFLTAAADIADAYHQRVMGTYIRHDAEQRAFTTTIDPDGIKTSNHNRGLMHDRQQQELNDVCSKDEMPDPAAYGLSVTWNEGRGIVLGGIGPVHSDDQSFSAKGTSLSYRTLLNLHP